MHLPRWLHPGADGNASMVMDVGRDSFQARAGAGTPAAPSGDGLTTRAPEGGETVAWRELRERVAAFVRRRVSTPDDAEDLVQEVLFRIDRNIDTVDEATPLSAWAFRVARNAVIDHYRATARSPEHPVEDVAALASVDPADDEGAHPVHGDLLDCLEPLMAELDPKYREALQLTEIEGLTQAEAAVRVGMSVPGMKSRVQRGRRHLAAAYHRHCRITFDARNAPLACSPREEGEPRRWAGTS